MNPKRVINLYLFLRRSEQLKLPFTIPRLAALAACSLAHQNSGTLKKEFGASQAFWSVTLSDLFKVGLLIKVPSVDSGWVFYTISKSGITTLGVLEETMTLETTHDSKRAKASVLNLQKRSARAGKVQSVQVAQQQKAHGPAPSGGETR